MGYNALPFKNTLPNLHEQTPSDTNNRGHIGEAGSGWNKLTQCI